MMKRNRLYPRLKPSVARVSAVGHAGGVLLTETIESIGLGDALREELSRWRKPLATHDPAKILLDLAVTLALGGDCAADIDQVAASPAVFGQVASKATVSRFITTLAGDVSAVEKVIAAATAQARAVAWTQAGGAAPTAVDERRPLIIDIDGTLVTSHSGKENAAPTFKRGFGFHPLVAFVDHGPEGTGEPVAMHLRPGNAGSNTANDHITVTRQALKQLPQYQGRTRMNKRVLIRADGGGGTRKFVNWLAKQHLGYSVGFTLPMDTADIYANIPADAWSPALNADGDIRDGADVADITGLLDLTGWPPGMRVIVRRERPHPGAQLRFDDVDGYRLTAFATNTRPGGVGGQDQHLELRHRRRARCEDRIRIAKDTGLANLPLQGFNQNRIWCLIVMLALNIVAWMQTLALTRHVARRWEPKKLRFRLYAIPATLVKRSRQRILKLADHAPNATMIADAITRLRATQPVLA